MANQAISIAKPMNCYPLAEVSPKKPGMAPEGGKICKMPAPPINPIIDCVEPPIKRGKCGSVDIFDKLPPNVLLPKCGDFPKPQPKCGGIGGAIINKLEPGKCMPGRFEELEKLPGKLEKPKPKPEFIQGQTIESHERARFHHHCKCPGALIGESWGKPVKPLDGKLQSHPHAPKPPMPHGPVNRVEDAYAQPVGRCSESTAKPLQGRPKC